jgi:small multidrug resistance pump
MKTLQVTRQANGGLHCATFASAVADAHPALRNYSAAILVPSSTCSTLAAPYLNQMVCAPDHRPSCRACPTEPHGRASAASPIARADGVSDMTPNTAYIYLSVAIISEVIGTLALKSSDGFSKVYPSLTVIAGYAVAFFFLSLALRTVPVGIAYAIWAGAGTALIVLVSAVLLKQSLDAAALIGIPLIVAGIVIINLGSQAAAH